MRRRGVTFMEVLLVVLLIGVIMALLLPAVMTVRVNAGRTQTNNNLKQCALAVHKFHDIYRRLPGAYDLDPGVYKKDAKSLWFVLLPYVEAENVYREARLDAAVPAYIAPSDRFLNYPAGRLSFAANLRVFAYGDFGPEKCNALGAALSLPPDGVILQSRLTLPRIVDGTSNTFMLATRYAECSGKTTRYAAHPAEHGGFWGAGTHSKSPAATGEDDDLMFQLSPKNDPRFSDACNPKPGLYGHSFGPSGLSTALCDGTVKHVRPTMKSNRFMQFLCPGDQIPLGDEGRWEDD